VQDKEILNWIYSNSGPAIRLRLSRKCMIDLSEEEKQSYVSELEKMEEVTKALHYFDAFCDVPIENKPLEHLIHYYKDICIDQFFPVVSDLGFYSGIRIFDEKMQYVADTFQRLLKSDFNFCHTYSHMLHRFFTMSGCITEEVYDSLRKRMELLHLAAKNMQFDIYQDATKLPKPPEQWLNRNVLKDNMNPFSAAADNPVPNIYDISALAYFRKHCREEDNIKKIEDIAAYVLSDEFQQLPEYYGLIWNKDRRIYHACGWAPHMPDFGDNREIANRTLINYLQMMSNFDSALKSDWFKKGILFLEKYKTEKGTYLFPKEYLWSRVLCPAGASDFLGLNIKCPTAFLSGEALGLKRKERELLLAEMIGTINVLELKQKMNCHM